VGPPGMLRRVVWKKLTDVLTVTHAVVSLNSATVEG
jgi:hypothetical protein